MAKYKRKASITPAQRSARRKNIAVARQARKKKSGGYVSPNAWHRAASSKTAAKKENDKIFKILRKRTNPGSRGGTLSIANPKRSQHHPANVRLLSRARKNMAWYINSGQGK